MPSLVATTSALARKPRVSTHYVRTKIASLKKNLESVKAKETEIAHLREALSKSSEDLKHEKTNHKTSLRKLSFTKNASPILMALQQIRSSLGSTQQHWMKKNLSFMKIKKEMKLRMEYPEEIFFLTLSKKNSILELAT